MLADFEEEGLEPPEEPVDAILQNRATIASISGEGHSVFRCLDDVCRRRDGDDQNFAQEVRNRIFPKARLPEDVFEIQHYFDTVRYSTKGFVENNRNRLRPEIRTLLRSSASAFIVSVVEGNENSNASDRANHSFLTRSFDKSSKDLQAIIDRTAVSFIRCIKTNDTQSAYRFDPILVEAQLHALGVIDTLRVKDHGYSIRIPREEFCHS